MSTLRGRSLQLDDPLDPGPSKQKQQPAPLEHGRGQTPALKEGKQAARRKHGETAPTSARSDGQQASRPVTGTQQERRTQDGTDTRNHAWREWSGLTGVGSFRLPQELLSELSDTARELRLPVGLIVTAAITQLLDQPPGEIAVLVDRADDARIQGRRQARRRVTTRRDD